MLRSPRPPRHITALRSCFFRTGVACAVELFLGAEVFVDHSCATAGLGVGTIRGERVPGLGLFVRDRFDRILREPVRLLRLGAYKWSTGRADTRSGTCSLQSRSFGKWDEAANNSPLSAPHNGRRT
jgi:hypothetical protein